MYCNSSDKVRIIWRMLWVVLVRILPPIHKKNISHKYSVSSRRSYPYCSLFVVQYHEFVFFGGACCCALRVVVVVMWGWRRWRWEDSPCDEVVD